MRKILVCFTGGTFSSKTNNNIMDVSASANDAFIETIKNKYSENIEFEFLNSAFMLSENMYPEIWEKITADINGRIKQDNKYSGIILIHGSDTAAYTTTFLNHYYRDLLIPFVVTASNAPIGEAHSNGLNNFHAAVDFVLKSNLSGVYFIYQYNENRGEKLIYKPEELLDASIYTDEFLCTHVSAYGIIQNKRFIAREKPEKTDNKRFTWSFNPFKYENKVLGIKPFTGLDYSVYDLKSKNIKAVVHSAYHSNTHNCNNEGGYDDYSIIAFIKKCDALNINVYLSDFPKNRLSMPIYESTASLIRLGAVPIYLPFESAYTKAIYAYNSPITDKVEYMMK